MRKTLPDGIWPTMITPFFPDGRVDYDSLEHLVHWYIEQGVDGLFAVCQSSEMFYLSFDEKIRIAENVVRAAAGRVPVISSGHTSDTIEGQKRELQDMASLDVEAIVLVTNRLAGEAESDQVFLSNMEEVIQGIPDSMMLGFYECPYPYKRLLSEPIIEYCLKSERYAFLKDTSCDSEIMKKRLQRLKDSGFKLFNANSATLSQALDDGASGYSGVMANFHPRLYKKLVSGQMKTPGSMDALQNLLGTLSAVENYLYPLSAKYHLKTLGVIESSYSRKHETDELPQQYRLLIDQMNYLIESLK